MAVSQAKIAGLSGRPHLDSYSGRLSWNPAPEWSAQISYGYLASPEELYPWKVNIEPPPRSATRDSLKGGRVLATTLAWAGTVKRGRTAMALLLESDWQVSRLYTVFGRAEYVEKDWPGVGSPCGKREIRHCPDYSRLLPRTIGGPTVRARCRALM